MGLCSPEN